MKYQIPIIIVLLVLVIAIFVYRRSYKKERVKGKKGGSKSKPKRGRNGRRGGKQQQQDDYEEENDARNDLDTEIDEIENGVGEDEDLREDAKELYDLVHQDMAQGMQFNEFNDIVGELAGDEPEEVFIEIKQKYTEYLDKNMDPLKHITKDDYVKALKVYD